MQEAGWAPGPGMGKHYTTMEDWHQEDPLPYPGPHPAHSLFPLYTGHIGMMG